MEMIAFEVEIVKKEYNDVQTKLINMWYAYIKGDRSGYLYLIKKAQKPSRTGIRLVNKIRTEFIKYMSTEKEMVRISELNYILLMAKCGVEVSFNEK